MSLSAPQKAVMRGVRDLEQDDVARGLGRDRGWDLAQVLVAAKQHDGGARAKDRTVAALCGRCLLWRRSRDGRYELTEAGRQRLREGL